VRPASAGEGDHGIGDWSGCSEWLKVAGVRDVDDGHAFAELFLEQMPVLDERGFVLIP
jgi:hypothetical protein